MFQSLKEQHLLLTIKRVLVPIHPEGYIFIGAFAVLSFILGSFSGFLGYVGWGATLWCVYFFRDPKRHTPAREGLIISPADGVVEMIAEVPAPAELGMSPLPHIRVSIFLNVLDVHIQRFPVSGTVAQVHYHKGAFFNAALDKASEENERNLVKITTASGKEVAVVQIAGWIARRIVCWTKKEDAAQVGGRYGLIRFGSRVDIYLPPGVNPLVSLGQRTLGGETVIADMNSTELARQATAQ